MRRTLILSTFLLGACSEREPPSGSGALETTPVSVAPSSAVAEPLSGPAVVAYPNGSVLVTDPKACRVTVFQDGEKRWAQDLTGCGGVVEASVAMDSVSYVRTAAAIAAFDPDGGRRWSTAIEQSTLPPALLAPTALADSRVALAVNPKQINVYERDGKVAWTFAAPTNESFSAAPVGMKTEGVIVSTSQATYVISASGELRWRSER